jgi:hypothetical protein
MRWRLGQDATAWVEEVGRPSTIIFTFHFRYIFYLFVLY